MNKKQIPYITVEQMREVDRMMIEEIGVTIPMMMENAGRAVAILARKILKEKVKDKNITLLCGKGNNGGDGLASARHLINWGGRCNIVLSTRAEKLKSEAKKQYNILKKYPAKIYEAKDNLRKIEKTLKSSDLIIDALLGFGLQRNPRKPIATLIKLANRSKRKILSVDIPSGLCANTGKAFQPTIKADVTLTLALPKIGFQKSKAKQYAGKLYLADLSVPKIVYNKLGIKTPTIFEKGEVVLL